jgi:hypothetical protein
VIQVSGRGKKPAPRAPTSRIVLRYFSAAEIRELVAQLPLYCENGRRTIDVDVFMHALDTATSDAKPKPAPPQRKPVRR